MTKWSAYFEDDSSSLPGFALLYEIGKKPFDIAREAGQNLMRSV